MKASWGLHAIAALLLTSYVFAERRPLENDGMFEGDIDGIDPYILYDRNAVINEAKIWPGGIIYYEIDGPLMKAKWAIDEAIEEFEAKTCLRFRKRTASTRDYCKLINGNGCYSSIGRQGRMQTVSLGEGCHDKVSAVHELMHAIGFWHEHSRSDRDDYLRINWQNIRAGKEHNFLKRHSLENNLLGEEFDFDSVMLYDSYSFSKNRRSLMTMVPKKPGLSIVPLDDKPGLSDQDAVKINKLYQCFGNKRPPPLEVPDFECNFEDGDICGMYNDAENERANWGAYRGTLGGRKSTYLALYERKSSTNVARLYTPEIKTYGRNTIHIEFDVYFNGAGASYLDVEAHVSGRTIHVMRENTREDEWINVSSTFQINGADVEFSFDGQTSKADGSGVIAIDNLLISLK